MQKNLESTLRGMPITNGKDYANYIKNKSGKGGYVLITDVTNVDTWHPVNHEGACFNFFDFEEKVINNKGKFGHYYYYQDLPVLMGDANRINTIVECKA